MICCADLFPNFMLKKYPKNALQLKQIDCPAI